MVRAERPYSSWQPRFEPARLFYLKPTEGVFKQTRSYLEVRPTRSNFEDGMGSDSATCDSEQY